MTEIKQTQVGKVYAPNIDKIAREFGSALEMCKHIGIPYGTYNNIIRIKRKKRIFKSEIARAGFYRLLDGGYIQIIGESNESTQA